MAIKITTLSENAASTTRLLAEWGLSILIEVNGTKILLDTGQTFSAAYNAIELGMDLSQVDKIVLSHGHFDHTGGLIHLLRLMKKEVEIIAHPDIWQAKYGKLPGEKEKYAGVPFPREEAERLGASFKLTKEPVWITSQMVTSGEIPMVTEYEVIDPVLYVKEGGELKPDPLRDDQAIFIKSEKGLVVILGCAHRGVINTIKHAQKLTGLDKIYAVIGGTHLISASPERLDLTIAQLLNMGIEKLGVSHCTGTHAGATLVQTFGDAFFYNNAGSSVTL